MRQQRLWTGVLRGAVALALLLGTALFAPEAEAAEVPMQRPRLVIDANYYPFSAMGRLQIAGVTFCTGTLVAPSVVLTAGHCLYNRPRQMWRPAQDVHFVAGYQRSSFVAHGQGVRYLTPLTRVGKAPDAETILQDWALVQLDRPIGKQVGWLGLARHDESSLERLRLGGAGEALPPLLLAAYREDRAHALSLQSPCRITRLFHQGAVVLDDCQVVHGSSGSPLVAFENGHFLVVGVTSAQVNLKNQPSQTATVSTSVFRDDFGEKAFSSFGLDWGAPQMRDSTLQKGMSILIAALRDDPATGANGDPVVELDQLLRVGPRRDKIALPPLPFPELRQCIGDCARSDQLPEKP